MGFFLRIVRCFFSFPIVEISHGFHILLTLLLKIYPCIYFFFFFIITICMETTTSDIDESGPTQQNQLKQWQEFGGRTTFLMTNCSCWRPVWKQYTAHFVLQVRCRNTLQLYVISFISLLGLFFKSKGQKEVCLDSLCICVNELAFYACVWVCVCVGVTHFC